MKKNLSADYFVLYKYYSGRLIALGGSQKQVAQWAKKLSSVRQVELITIVKRIKGFTNNKK